MYCAQCGESIEQNSNFCRFCGAAQPGDPARGPATLPEAPPAPPVGKILFGIVAVLLFIILVAALSLSPRTAAPPAPLNVVDVDTVAENVEDVAAIVDAAPTPAPTPETSWRYSSDEDKVRGGKSYFARATSSNEIQLDAPYDGGSSLSMTVRKSPAYGTDVYFVLSSGQLMCPSYEGCYGTVRFDDGPAQRVAFNGPSDNSSDTVFVEGAAGFIAKLKRARKVIVELEIYQSGRPQFEFDVKGLDWAH